MATKENLARCTLCPGLCALGLGWNGPDLPRVEYPSDSGAGLCPRGSALGELLASPARLRWARRREGRRLVDMDFSGAIAAAAERISGGATVLMDGGCSVEEIAAAAEIAAAWEGVRLCLVVAPDDEQMLLGVEASGANYLADEELANCDGFVVVGDPFAVNPRCARGVLDALRAQRRAPLVVIDSGGGVAAGFATMRAGCRPGGELEALQSDAVASAVEPCRKLGVLLAADPGRGAGWGRIGYLAGKLANAHGGGVSVQTVGANALAAVRARKQLALGSLAEAATPGRGEAVRVALGVDMLGLLGWAGPAVAVAAAAVANPTTNSAEIILPLALPCESGGTFLQAGTRRVSTAPLLSPPAGVPTPAELLAKLAAAAGVKTGPWSGKLPSLDRLTVEAPAEVAAGSTTGRSLVAASQALLDAGGALMGQASWQRQVRPLPELRMSPADAGALGVADLAEVTVETESHSTAAKVRLVDWMAAGTMAISAGFYEARELLPYTIDAERDMVVSRPAAVQVSK